MEIELARTRDLNGEWLVVGDEVQIMPHRTARVLRIYREQGSRQARIEVSNRMYDLWFAATVAKVAP
jgi:hypothetical protein